jgi:hypothetical protein
MHCVRHSAAVSMRYAAFVDGRIVSEARQQMRKSSDDATREAASTIPVSSSMRTTGYLRCTDGSVPYGKKASLIAID